MCIDESIKIRSNCFKAEDLVVYNKIIVPFNSPIEEAIEAIRKNANHSCLDISALKIIAKKKFEILKTDPPIVYFSYESWKVTFFDQAILIKYPGIKEASIIMHNHEANHQNISE